MTNRIPQGADGWMRDIERRLLQVERRPVPSIGTMGNVVPMANQITDWNADEALLSGWVWSDINSLNGPDQVRVWIGMVVSTTEGHGIQVTWSHVTGLAVPDQYVRTYHKHDTATTPFFSAWGLV